MGNQKHLLLHRVQWGVLYVEPVKAVTQETAVLGLRTCPVTVTRWQSEEPFSFSFCKTAHWVDAVTQTDFGKHGKSTVLTVHQDYSETACREGQRSIEETLKQVMNVLALW